MDKEMCSDEKAQQDTAQDVAKELVTMPAQTLALEEDTEEQKQAKKAQLKASFDDA
jgi:hypothetical protein